MGSWTTDRYVAISERKYRTAAERAPDRCQNDGIGLRAPAENVSALRAGEGRGEWPVTEA